MAHLTDEVLATHAFDGVALSDADAAHLAACAACAARAGEFAMLSRSLEVARRSEPTAQALAQARALYRHVQSETPLQRAANWVRARLALDTRSSAVLQGMRGMDTAYRLLYTTSAADIELAVEPVNGVRRVEGELLPLGDPAGLLPALVQLESEEEYPPAEVQTDADGRFRIERVAPGRYRLWIAFGLAGDVLVEGLEID